MVVFRFLDQKFRQYPLKYIAQCLIASASILVILSFLNLFHQTTMIASLGASTFIVFAMPSAHSANPRGLIGGYLVGVITGVIFGSMLAWLTAQSAISPTHSWYMAFGALAVGVTIFLMVITNTEHPPAVGMALAVVTQPWDSASLLFVLAAAVLLAATRALLGQWLIDLH